MRYIDGRSLKKHYCIKCGIKEICYSNFLYGSKKCRSCHAKDRFSILENNTMFGIHRVGIENPNYKDGRTLIEHFCIDCGKKLSNYIFTRCHDCHNKHLIGINNGNWQGGKSFEEYGQEFDSSLKEQVRFRDNYKCQECGCSQLENGRTLDVHHIDYDKKNNVINNLISLCKSCHMKTASGKNRKFWITHYQNKTIGELK